MKMNEANMINDLMPLAKLTSKYDLSMSRVYKATHGSEFPYYRGTGRKVFVRECDFVHWLTAKRVPGVNEISCEGKIPA